MARRMLTAEEIRNHTPIFMGVAWVKRGIQIKNRLAKKHAQKAM